MRQVFDHALVDVDQYPTTLWNILEVRFTQARLEKLQGYLNEIGHFKLNQNEENNIFIDRFKTLVVRCVQNKVGIRNIFIGWNDSISEYASYYYRNHYS